MPLTYANISEELIIKKIGGSSDLKRHLESLGFAVGGRVRIINVIGGNIIVSVKETRVAISRETAQKIII